MNWITEIVEATEQVVTKSFEWMGQERTGYFRCITAAERAELLAGQRFFAKNGAAEAEIDLGNNEKTKQKMVFFSAVNEDGTRLFATARDVAKLPAMLLEKLYSLANEVNRDKPQDEAGNA